MRKDGRDEAEQTSELMAPRVECAAVVRACEGLAASQLGERLTKHGGGKEGRWGKGDPPRRSRHKQRDLADVCGVERPNLALKYPRADEVGPESLHATVFRVDSKFELEVVR